MREKVKEQPRLAVHVSPKPLTKKLGLNETHYLPNTKWGLVASTDTGLDEMDQLPEVRRQSGSSTGA